MRPFLCLTGPTGVGKSKVAVSLCKLLGGDSSVISADSMQVYKGLDIGTAKVTTEEMQGVRHFMLDVVEPSDAFSAFDYAQEVSQRVLPQIKDVAVIAGGTGLYFDALLYGLDFPSDNSTAKLRKELTALYESEGISAIQAILKEKDPAAYEKIDLKNARRVIRAIEIACTGSSITHKNAERKPLFPYIMFQLEKDRADMYENIEKRVEQMLSDGLVEEVRALVDKYGRNRQCFSAIGYREIIDYLDGKLTLQQAAEAIKLNTRHYAKRQLTYFKRFNAVKINAARDSDIVAREIYEKYIKISQKI